MKIEHNHRLQWMLAIARPTEPRRYNQMEDAASFN